MSDTPKLKAIHRQEAQVAIADMNNKFIYGDDVSSAELYYWKTYNPPNQLVRSYRINGRRAIYVRDAICFLWAGRVSTPPYVDKDLIRLIKNKQLDGFQDERVINTDHSWMVYEDSLVEWLKTNRRMSVSKAA